MSEEVNWDVIVTELDWGVPEAVGKMSEVFSFVNPNNVPGGVATLVRAEEMLSLHPRIGELRELLKEVALDTLNDAIEFYT